MRGSIRWLYPSGEPQIESDDVGHGTCVASKVVSPTFGVAKSANIVVVRMQLVNGMILTSSVIAACGIIAWAVSNQTLEHRDLELTFNTKCLQIGSPKTIGTRTLQA